MKAFEIPSLSQEECEKIVAAEHLCRIAFHGEKYPYLAPFIYVWQNNHLYFLSANYGAKIIFSRKSPGGGGNRTNRFRSFTLSVCDALWSIAGGSGLRGEKNHSEGICFPHSTKKPF